MKGRLEQELIRYMYDLKLLSKMKTELQVLAEKIMDFLQMLSKMLFVINSVAIK